jgi:hypothetical protein
VKRIGTDSMLRRVVEPHVCGVGEVEHFECFLSSVFVIASLILTCRSDVADQRPWR